MAERIYEGAVGTRGATIVALGVGRWVPWVVSGLVGPVIHDFEKVV